MSNVIYIACALTHVPREVFAQYAEYQHRMARQIHLLVGCEVKYALINSDPQLAQFPESERATRCYSLDREIVQSSCLVIGECSFPSIGLGIELQIAQARNIPIILLHSADNAFRSNRIEYKNPDQTKHELQIGNGYITLMALGIPCVRAAFEQEFDCQDFTRLTDKILEILADRLGTRCAD